MPRPKTYPEHALARLPAGTIRRISRVLRGEESQAAYLRSAVERELQIRERVALVVGRRRMSKKRPRG